MVDESDAPLKEIYGLGVQICAARAGWGHGGADQTYTKKLVRLCAADAGVRLPECEAATLVEQCICARGPDLVGNN